MLHHEGINCGVSWALPYNSNAVLVWCQCAAPTSTRRQRDREGGRVRHEVTEMSLSLLNKTSRLWKVGQQCLWGKKAIILAKYKAMISKTSQTSILFSHIPLALSKQNISYKKKSHKTNNFPQSSNLVDKKHCQKQLDTKWEMKLVS